MLCCDLLLKVVSESSGSGEEDGTPDLTSVSSDDSDDYMQVHGERGDEPGLLMCIIMLCHIVFLESLSRVLYRY